LGLLVQRSNSLYSSVIAHMCYNTVGALFLVVPRLQRIPDRHVIAAGVIALLLAVWLLWSFARRFPTPTEELPPRESSSWAWPIVSLVAVLSFGTVVALFVRFSSSLPGR